MPLLTRRQALTTSLATAAAALTGGMSVERLVEGRAAAEPVNVVPAKVPYGVALNRWALAEPEQRAPYLAAIERYAVLAVPEDGFYWEQTRPGPEEFDFRVADQLLAIAEERHLPFRGHVLIWHGAMPKWTEDIGSAREAERQLVGHVERVVSRYKGRISKWNAVNETIEETPGSGSNGMRPSLWYRWLGERYIDIALRTAKGVDPGAALLINDYGIESSTRNDSSKRQAYIGLLRRLRDRNGAISGVGIQGHVRGEDAIDAKGLAQFCKDVRALDLDLLLTEIDVSDDKLPADIGVRDGIVAKRTAELLETVFSVERPREVYTWGISDRYTWMPTWFKRKDGLENRCLPLDRDYRPKPMLKVIEKFCRTA